jgi:hypothetical protein
MTRSLSAFLGIVGVVVIGALPFRAEAHRLDEYLQATRVALGTDRIDIELDLTPGAAVAASIFPLIDRDGDFRITPTEIEGYARAVVTDLTLQVNGRAYPLTLTRAECPSWPEMRDGIGTIAIAATAAAPLGRGDHRVSYENFHRRDIGVFMANALVPADAAITIAGQERDRDQRRFDLDITVRPAWSKYFWPVLPSLVLAALIIVRRR